MCDHTNGIFFGCQGAPDLYDCRCGFQVFGKDAHQWVDEARHVIDGEFADINIEA